jgi:hypothetical protein
MSTHTIDGAMDIDGVEVAPLARARTSAFRLPPREPGPRGTAQGALRELLSLIARRSESYAWRYDADEWSFGATDRAMLHGSLEALEPFGIASGHRIEETDSPARFEVVSPDGSKRILELSWDSISYDLMSMPPHVKRLNGLARAGLLGGGITACWVGIYALLAAVGAF